MAPKDVKFIDDSIKTDNDDMTTEKIVYKPRIQWSNVAVNLFIHFGSLVGVYHMLTLQPKWQTYIWFLIVTVLCNLSVCIGVHRLWSHRSFKAVRKLRLLLLFFYTMAGQSSVYNWVKVHRVHHKFAETEKDPLNFRRGFFFAHVGWYCLTFHPECEKEMKRIDMKDIEADKDIMFQYNNYEILFFIFNIMLPVLTPCYFWNESLWISFWVCFVTRFAINFTQLNFTNSANHFIGRRPYDKGQSATDNLAMVFFSFGEGYHNYHHVFPYDYRSGEFGDIGHYNLSAVLIDFFAKFGWVYDRKMVSSEMISRRVMKSGDGTHFLSHEEAHKNAIYGYGDKDIDPDDQEDLDNMKN
ncbi:CLUMA_CG012124, isoform A [Clunio marinus]|uniref:CLUMA_CG012124, isoform A n=1 Tax=Clunio marinus TaxID=568069 RepID=A0A1J1IGV2_9DIPT|nr:CLUMA_CG012124, isoform A [Clunio marinus]